MSSRKKFLLQSSALLGGGLLASAVDNQVFAIFNNRIMPSDQLNVGVIGVNGMGWADATSAIKIPGVNLVAICDIDKSVIQNRLNELTKKNIDISRIKIYSDYRKLLEQKDIDIVIIGTPDHWHALMMIEAVQAGKDVYVEKPVGNSIIECRAMVAAQQRYNKVVQGGQWQRSQQHFKDAVSFVHSGQLGNIRTVKVWCYQGWMRPEPVVPNSAPPEGVDYKQWLGPATTRPFNSSRFHFHFRWFWDYAGGLMTDWGVHEIDIALYAMGVKAPKSVMASGGKFAYPDDASETPDTLQTVYEYDGFNMLWEHATGIDGGNYGSTEGIAFIGNNATLVVNRGGWKVIPETENKDGQRINKIAEVPHTKPIKNAHEAHAVNFIDAITNNDISRLNCGIQTGSIAAINAQMGNIAYKTGKKVYWDAAKNQFTDSEANQLMKARYNNGWQVPKV